MGNKISSRPVMVPHDDHIKEFPYHLDDKKTKVFSSFALCCKACHAQTIRHNALVLIRDKMAQELEIMKPTSTDDMIKGSSDGNVSVMEMIISSKSVNARSTKENACREILKCKAIDIMVVVLGKIEVLIDQDPSVFMPPSLPDPIKQLQYLPNMDFVVFKVVIQEWYKPHKSLLLMKQAQIFCDAIEESRIVTSCEDNLAAVTTNFIYLKTAGSTIEAVIKEHELEECVYLIIVGGQPNLMSNDKWLAFKKKLKMKLQSDFERTYGFLVEQLVPASVESTCITTVEAGEDKIRYKKTTTTCHCCQESSQNVTSIIAGHITT